jgi:hypothetical protein
MVNPTLQVLGSHHCRISIPILAIDRHTLEQILTGLVLLESILCLFDLSKHGNKYGKSRDVDLADVEFVSSVFV